MPKSWNLWTEKAGVALVEILSPFQCKLLEHDHLTAVQAWGHSSGPMFKEKLRLSRQATEANCHNHRRKTFERL